MDDEWVDVEAPKKPGSAMPALGTYIASRLTAKTATITVYLDMSTVHGLFADQPAFRCRVKFGKGTTSHQMLIQPDPMGPFELNAVRNPKAPKAKPTRMYVRFVRPATWARMAYERELCRHELKKIAGRPAVIIDVPAPFWRRPAADRPRAIA